jgi:hypothetical protein
MHDPRQHVVDLGEFLVDEENALAPVGQQPGQLIFIENICHSWASYLNRLIASVPIQLQKTHRPDASSLLAAIE